MAIAVDWDVKHQTKKAHSMPLHLTMADLFYRNVDCEMGTKYSAILFVNVVDCIKVEFMQ